MKRGIIMVVTNRLKKILENRGIKQTWLAEKVGVTRGNMSNIINNRQQTTIEVAFKIADILNLKLEDIFIYSKDEL